MRVTEGEDGLVVEAELEACDEATAQALRDALDNPVSGMAVVHGYGECAVEYGPDAGSRLVTAFELDHVELFRPANAQPKGEG